MSSLPLARYESFRSADLVETREKVRHILGSHRLELAGNGNGLDARMHSCRVRDISVNYLGYGGDVLVEFDPFETFYAVVIPLSGKVVANLAERVCVPPGLALVVAPDERVEMRWTAECRALIVRIERTALEVRLSELTAGPLHEPLRFSPAMDVGGGHAMSWYRLLRLMIDELDRPGSLLESTAKSRMFEHHLVTLLLEIQPHNYTDALDLANVMVRRCRTKHPRYVREAMRLIQDHPEWEHTTSSLAGHVGVTERTLQKAFRRHVSQSPSQFLREVRLQRVHEALRSAPRDEVTVDGLARRWGFTHHGRFAALYRQRFGRAPSETLRQ